MEKRTALRELVAQKQVFAPCVFDNISVRTVELCGYEATVLDGDEIAYAMCGLPGAEMLNAEELIWLMHRMTDYTQLPVIGDMKGSMELSELTVYENAYRLAKNGAAAVIVDDSAEGNSLCSAEDAYARIKAAKKACENTDCMVIFRTQALQTYNLEEAIARCKTARSCGADITGIAGLKNKQQAEEYHRQDAGIKMWFSLGADNGVSDIEPEEADALNFKIISLHYTAKGAFYGMLYYGKRTLKDGNTVFHDTHDFDGLLNPGQDYHELFSFWKKWLPLEDCFNDVSEVMSKTYDIKL